jgi:hypothetical protein
MTRTCSSPPRRRPVWSIRCPHRTIQNAVCARRGEKPSSARSSSLVNRIGRLEQRRVWRPLDQLQRIRQNRRPEIWNPPFAVCVLCAHRCEKASSVRAPVLVIRAHGDLHIALFTSPLFHAPFATGATSASIDVSIASRFLSALPRSTNWPAPAPSLPTIPRDSRRQKLPR